MEKELVLYVAKALVDEPDEVEVNMIEGEKSTILELKVGQARADCEGGPNNTERCIYKDRQARGA